MITLTEWSEEELALAAEDVLILPLGVKRDAPTSTDAPPTPGLASSVYMSSRLTSQILGYQRQLQTTWMATLDELVAVARVPGHNQGLGGFQIGDEAAKPILTGAIAGFTAAASHRYERAFETGQRTAVRFTERSRVSDQEAETMIGRLLRRNEGFVRGSLFTDLQVHLATTTRDPTVAPPSAGQSVRDYGESQLWRVGMYALALWGVGHLAFGTELVRSLKQVDWVLTSLEPCQDCPRLSNGGPYSTTRPLPTVPGSGQTQCKTNCLCLLVEAK